MAKYRRKALVEEAVQYYSTNKESRVNACFCEKGHTKAHVHTDHGLMRLCEGDWIVTSVSGNKYTVKPGVFQLSYEHAA